jgi:flagellar motor switch protein FliN/FliY
MENTPYQATAQLVQLPELSPTMPAGAPVVGENLQLLRGLKVQVRVQVGEAQTTLGELMALKGASILKLDRLVDEPIDVIVDGKLFARGQLVAVDDNFGVQITEIAQA